MNERMNELFLGTKTWHRFSGEVTPAAMKVIDINKRKEKTAREKEVTDTHV